MKKKGFTLIELLAVIVILAIIALIATPIILSVISKAEKGAAEVSAIGYVNAVENYVITSELKGTVVADGEYKTSDISVSIKGEPPTSGTYTLEKGIVKTGTFCINNYNIEYSNSKAKATGKCGEESKKDTLSDVVKVGNYISMTPTSTSFTTDTSMTGYGSTQTLNPSELNLWRVIRINDDGTIEMVSEYASSIYVYFYGQLGYQNLVGYLNVIANQYTNDKYVKETRHMGYNGQTEYIKDTTALASTIVTWTCNTGESCNPDESQGGGDTLYTTDINLVKTATGTILAFDVNKKTCLSYWLASRYSGYYKYYSAYSGRCVVSAGFYSMYETLYYSITGASYDNGYAIRPILTLKSGLTATGSGTSDDPYVLP